MTKKLIIVLLLCTIALLLVIIVIKDEQPNTQDSETQESSQETLRNYKIGIAGYTPANLNEPKVEDVLNFWREIEANADYYGIHTDWKDTQLINLAVDQLDLDLNVVLGFQNPEEWLNSQANYIEVAKSLLQKYPQIKYLAIGNEVNLLKETYPAEFPNFISAYKAIYDSLKVDYPEVTIYTTFQFEALAGNGYLTGKKDTREPDYNLVAELESKLDIIGLTLYPYFDYTSPSFIPDDYLSGLTSISQKPIAITETGWMSRETYGGDLATLGDEGYTGSEEEQVNYIKRLVSLVENYNVVFITWFPLNDLTNWQNGDDPEKFELFDSIGLKKYDGTPKLAWEEWIKW